MPVAPHSLYERCATLYADYRLHRFPDDRPTVAAALDLDAARSFAEFGCGPGLYATTFAARYPHLRVAGIDRAPAQVAIARRRAAAQSLANVRFLRGDVRSLPLPAGVFDRALASRLLMIVPEREAALAEMRRLLVPGGILLLAEPVVRPSASVLAALRSAAGDTMPDLEPEREHVFTAPAFAALVRSAAWARMAIWEASGYRYARCVKLTHAER